MDIQKRYKKETGKPIHSQFWKHFRVDYVMWLQSQLIEAHKTIEAKDKELAEARELIPNLHIDFTLPCGQKEIALVSDILKNTIESIEHLLYQHDCDCLGHESRLYGLVALREILKKVMPTKKGDK